MEGPKKTPSSLRTTQKERVYQPRNSPSNINPLPQYQPRQPIPFIEITDDDEINPKRAPDFDGIFLSVIFELSWKSIIPLTYASLSSTSTRANYIQNCSDHFVENKKNTRRLRRLHHTDLYRRYQLYQQNYFKNYYQKDCNQWRQNVFSTISSDSEIIIQRSISSVIVLRM